jgi:hypothetical protein
MRFRKLRIAWTVFCGIACVLLIVLSVRSYWRYDAVARIDGALVEIRLFSNRGAVGVIRMDWSDANTNFVSHGWQFESSPTYDLSAFYWNWTDSGDGMIRLPIWCLTPPIVVISTLSWTPKLSRFSLRTLLVATTLIAVVLGLIVWLR